MIVKGEYVPDDTDSQKRRIIDKLKEGSIPDELHDKVDEWLLAGKNDELTNKLMFEVFDEVFDFEQNPGARSYEMFDRFMSERKRLAPRKKRTLSSYKMMQYRIIAGLIAVMATIGGVIYFYPAAKRLAENKCKKAPIEVSVATENDEKII